VKFGIAFVKFAQHLPYIGCVSPSQGQDLQGVEERNGNVTNFVCDLHLALLMGQLWVQETCCKNAITKHL
jgi:hypothetical protein